MIKIKSFFKKHYKKLITVSVTTFLCFTYLLSSVFAASDYDFNVKKIDLSNISLTNVGTGEGSVTVFDIDNPKEIVGFQYPAWGYRVTHSLSKSATYSLYFTVNQKTAISSGYYTASIPFGLYYLNGASSALLKKITSCVVSFSYLDKNTNQWSLPIYCNSPIEFSTTGSTDVVCLKGSANFGIFFSSGMMFENFMLSICYFDGDVSGTVASTTSYAFAFRDHVSFKYGLSVSPNVDFGSGDYQGFLKNLEDSYSIIDIETSVDSVHQLSKSVPTYLFTSLNFVTAYLNKIFKVYYMDGLLRYLLFIGLLSLTLGIVPSFVGSLSSKMNRRK